MFSLTRLPVPLILAIQACLTASAPLTEYISLAPATREKYVNNSIKAVNTLNERWFDMANGLWEDMWWQSANFLCTHADLTDLAPDRFMETSRYYFTTSVELARESNGGDFHNAFYDDEGWWAMALIRVYDITGQQRYLDDARETFEDMKTGRNGACGGHWWSKDHTYIASIANELYLNVAAALGNRVDGRREYYRDLALESADWFLDSGLITSNDTVRDGLDSDTCEPTGTIFSYNSGVIIGALVELHKLVPGADRYMTRAHAVAAGALEHLVDDDGILTEVGAPEDLDPTRAMFKGVFVRNLKYLQAASPKADYVAFLQKNADALWDQNRDREAGERGLIGPNWQGKYHEASASSQGSGLDLLVAAAAVSE